MTNLLLRCSRWSKLMIGAAAIIFAIGIFAASALAADTKTKEKVDLNTASEKDLQELPGVGEATAKKIIAGRPYKSVAGLSKAGVNDAEIDKLKGLVIATEPKMPAKTEEKPSDKSKAAENGKASDNGKMKSADKMADSAKGTDKEKSSKMESKTDSKMDAKSTKDAAAKTTDKMAAADKPVGPKIDLNTASEKELIELPGVGEATAKKIIAGRPYKSLEGLSKAGVNDAEIAKLKPLVMVSDVKPPAKSDPSQSDSKMANAESKPAKKSDKMESADSKKADKKADSAKGAKKEKDKTPEPVTPPPTDKEIKDATAKNMVWANLNSKVYHTSGDHWYGKTHHGKFMTEDDAKKEGYTKAHMNENSDETKDTKSK